MARIEINVGVLPLAERGGMLDLEAERAKQIDRLIDLDFHKELQMSEAEYRAEIPVFLPQPKYFDIPLVVDPRVPLTKQYDVAGIKQDYVSHIVSVTDAPKDKPYTIWTHDAMRYRRESVDRVAERFFDGEVGGTQEEVVALFLQKPGIFKSYGVEAMGSRGSFQGVPFVSVHNHVAKAGVRRSGFKAARWGVLTRAEKINSAS